MNNHTIIKPAGAPPPVGPYNHAIRVGSLVFCSGQIPLDPATGALVPGDVKAQTDRAIENLKLILAHEQMTLVNVVKTTVFLTDMADFGAVNEVYARHFTRDYPARSAVQVAALPRGARVEIEAIAAD